MNRFRQIALLGVTAALAGAASAADRPPAPGACRAEAGGAAVLVKVTGLKDASGNLRVQLYGDRPQEFLEKGAQLRRVEMPAPPGSEASLCVLVEKPGLHAIVALHDRNANGKLDLAGDGVGFSRDPRLGFSKPKYDDVAFTVRPGVQSIEIRMNYRQGMAVRPLARP